MASTRANPQLVELGKQRAAVRVAERLKNTAAARIHAATNWIDTRRQKLQQEAAAATFGDDAPLANSPERSRAAMDELRAMLAAVRSDKEERIHGSATTKVIVETANMTDVPKPTDKKPQTAIQTQVQPSSNALYEQLLAKNLEGTEIKTALRPEARDREERGIIDGFVVAKFDVVCAEDVAAERIEKIKKIMDDGYKAFLEHDRPDIDPVSYTVRLIKEGGVSKCEIKAFIRTNEVDPVRDGLREFCDDLLEHRSPAANDIASLLSHVSARLEIGGDLGGTLGTTETLMSLLNDTRIIVDACANRDYEKYIYEMVLWEWKRYRHRGPSMTKKMLKPILRLLPSKFWHSGAFKVVVKPIESIFGETVRSLSRNSRLTCLGQAQPDHLKAILTKNFVEEFFSRKITKDVPLGVTGQNAVDFAAIMMIQLLTDDGGDPFGCGPLMYAARDTIGNLSSISCFGRSLMVHAMFNGFNFCQHFPRSFTEVIERARVMRNEAKNEYFTELKKKLKEEAEIDGDDEEDNEKDDRVSNSSGEGSDTGDAVSPMEKRLLENQRMLRNEKDLREGEFEDKAARYLNPVEEMLLEHEDKMMLDIFGTDLGSHVGMLVQCFAPRTSVVRVLVCGAQGVGKKTFVKLLNPRFPHFPIDPEATDEQGVLTSFCKVNDRTVELLVAGEDVLELVSCVDVILYLFVVDEGGDAVVSTMSNICAKNETEGVPPPKIEPTTPIVLVQTHCASPPSVDQNKILGEKFNEFPCTTQHFDGSNASTVLNAAIAVIREEGSVRKGSAPGAPLDFGY